MEDTLIRLVLRNKLVWLYMCICVTWATLLAHLLGDPIRAFGVVVGCAPGTMMITVRLKAYGIAPDVQSYIQSKGSPLYSNTLELILNATQHRHKLDNILTPPTPACLTVKLYDA